MKIAFHGAARCVTGSKHLITLKNGRKVLLDCGMFQGMGKETNALNRYFGFDPITIDAMILSHAHIDHSGLIPRLTKEGFKGKIFCTPATMELTNVLLADSAEIQEDDIKYENKRRAAAGQPYLTSLYTIEDAKNSQQHFVTFEYNNWFDVIEDVQAMFTDAGHIIGSTCVHLRIKEDGITRTLSFSADVGRYRDVILKSPQNFPQAEFILLESTYGNSLHEEHFTTPDQLLQWIDKTCLVKKGKLIMPAFSVGRTQEILYALNQLEIENRLPDLEYFSAIVVLASLIRLALKAPQSPRSLVITMSNTFCTGLSAANVIPAPPPALLTILLSISCIFFCIRTHLNDRILCTAKLGSTHHFHCFCDLLCTLYRLDPVANFF